MAAAASPAKSSAVAQPGLIALDPAIRKLGVVASGPAIRKLGVVASDPAIRKLGVVASDPAIRNLGVVASDPAIRNLRVVASDPAIRNLRVVASDPAIRKLGLVAGGPALAALRDLTAPQSVALTLANTLPQFRAFDSLRLDLDIQALRLSKSYGSLREMGAFSLDKSLRDLGQSMAGRLAADMAPLRAMQAAQLQSLASDVAAAVATMPQPEALIAHASDGNDETLALLRTLVASSNTPRATWGDLPPAYKALLWVIAFFGYEHTRNALEAMWTLIVQWQGAVLP